MELWIRSQDKKDLINVSEYLSIEETNFSEDIEYVKNPNKRPFFIECSNCILGFYATKERALEVLDEIQNILNLKDMYKYDRELVLKSWENVDEEQVKIVRQQMSVYEMPEE